MSRTVTVIVEVAEPFAITPSPARQLPSAAQH
jgi:hypothetical protein